MSGNKNENLVPSGGREKYGGSRNNRNETRLVFLDGSGKKSRKIKASVMPWNKGTGNP